MALLLALLAPCSLWATAPAHASTRLPGPAFFSTGLVDEDMFQSTDPTVRADWLGRARSIGSTWIRLRANWYQIAPSQRPANFRESDPAAPGYSWTRLDASLRSAAAAHQRVLLELVAPPLWALGPHAPKWAPIDSWRPNARDLGAFARALATRYSGAYPDPLLQGHRLPRVSNFQILNEPNLGLNLSPQWTKSPKGVYIPTGAYIYRSLLNAGYRNIKAVQPHAVVVIGGLAPYGDPVHVHTPPRYLNRMPPVVFLRELLCLRGARLKPEKCPQPAHFDGLDHHPYGLSPTVHAISPNDAAVPDIGRLTRIIRAARRLHRVLPRRPKSLWVTEIDWDTNPPDPNSRVSLSTQARYLSLAFYELWRQGVSHVFWFLLRDAPYTGPLRGSGLFFLGGKPKPGASAFRFPFVAQRKRRLTTVWGRSPRPGRVLVQRRVHGAWRTVRSLRTTRGEVFYATLRLKPRLLLRAVQHGVASLPYRSG